jgi:type IV fimbrial biogenesis protein FimT
MLNGHPLQRGFTLLEMAVALAILGLLLLAAAPSYTTYVANNKLRTTAEAFYGLVQKARSEAIRRNEAVDLLLTNDAPPAAGAAGADAAVLTLAASTTGRNWVIRAPNAASDRMIDSRVSIEAGGADIAVTSGASTITFNGLGETTSANAVLVAFRHPTQNTSCLLTEGVRCLNVRISVGGQARLCEPNQPSTDSRSC